MLRNPLSVDLELCEAAHRFGVEEPTRIPTLLTIYYLSAQFDQHDIFWAVEKTLRIAVNEAALDLIMSLMCGG